MPETNNMIINESIQIAQSPQVIWNYLMDVSNDVYWRTGMTRAQWTSRPPHGIGSTGEHTHKDMGLMNWEITRYDDGSSYEFIHTAGGLKGSIATFQVETENSGSRVNVQMRISGPVFMRFMMLFMRRVMRESVQVDLQKLKVLLEDRDTNA